MTIDSCGRRVQQPTLMNRMEALVPSPARLEVTPTSESFGTGGQEAYAASPNSLYMYEEKHDTLNFDPVNPAVPSPTLLSAEDFDHFENNTLDISNMTPANGSFQTTSSSGGSSSAQSMTRDVRRGKTMTSSVQDTAPDTGLRLDKAEMGQEPTLNELNLDESLLDDLNLESLLQNVDTSVFASGAPSPLPDSKPASGVSTPLQEGSVTQTPLMTMAEVTRALDSYTGRDNGSSQPAPSKSQLSAQPSPPTYTGSFTCQPIKREPYDPEYETGQAEDKKTLLHRLLLGRPQMQQQQQQLQMPLPQQSFQSQKSVPTTSTPASSSSSTSSSTTNLSPLRFRVGQNGSYQPLSTPLSSSRTPTAPRLKFSPAPASAPTLVKQEPLPSPLNVLRGSGHVSFPPSSSNPQQQAATSSSSSRSTSRGVKRTLSAVEGEDSQNTMERKWREIEQFIHDPETAEAEQEDSTLLKTQAHKKVRHASANSTRASSIEASSEVDTDDDDDSDNDLDSDLEALGEMESLLDDKTTGSGKKKERQYFWQYNVQAKGPKGTRLRLLIDNSNPHKVHKFEDPVFDPGNTMVAGIRHGGKARKGDGNEVTPNPKKFYEIGLQIRRLNHLINELGNANDLPAPQRNTSRKQKNKLASRACRLKKKAQHEANKVKLFGLNLEHKRMMYVLQTMEQQLVDRAADILKRRQTGALADSTEHQKPLTATFEEMVKTHLTEPVAGNGTGYVNTVILNVEKGDPTGGLDISKSKG